MRRRFLIFGLCAGLAAVALAAVSAPAEVLNNLDFFSDFEMLANLEILEDETTADSLVAVSTAPLLSTAAATAVVSVSTVKVSTSTRRFYEKR